MNALKISTLMLCTLFTTNCTKINNNYSVDILACGELAPEMQGAELRKIMSDDGSEFSRTDVEAYTWKQGQLEPVTLSSKACFTYDSEQNYVFRAKDQREGAFFAASALSNRSEAYLRPLSQKQAAFECPTNLTREVSSRYALLTEADDSQGFLFSNPPARTVSATVLLKSRSTGELVDQRTYLLGEDQKLDWQLPNDINDGSYTLELQGEELLSQTTLKPLTCALEIDRQAPELSSTNFQEKTKTDFQHFKPNAKLSFVVNDDHNATFYTCWIAIDEDKKQDFATKDPTDCDYFSSPKQTEAPSQGYWRLQYYAIDAAGNSTEISTANLQIVDQDEIENIEVLAQSLPDKLDETTDGLDTVLAALRAESVRRTLPTEYERNLAKEASAKALAKISVMDVPFRKLEGTGGLMEALAYSSDGTYLVTSDITEGVVKVFREDNSIAWQKQHPQGVTFLAISPDNRFVATTGMNRDVILWSLENGEKVFHDERAGRMFMPEFSRDGRFLVVGGADEKGRVYDIASSVEINEPKIILEFRAADIRNNQIFRSAFIPSGNAILITNGDSVYIHNLEDKSINPYFSFENKAKIIMGFKPLDNDTLVISSIDASKPFPPSGFDVDTTISFVDTKSKSVIKSTTTKGIIQLFQTSPNNKHLIGSSLESNGPKLWIDWKHQLVKNGEITPLSIGNKNERVQELQWSQDNSMITYINNDRELRIYDLDIANTIKSIKKTKGNLATGFALSPEANTIAIASFDNQIRFWNTKKKIFPLFNTNQFAAGLDISPDNELLLVTEIDTDGNVIINIFNISGRRLKRIKTGLNLDTSNAAQQLGIFNVNHRSPRFIDDQTILIIGDNEIKVLDWQTESIKISVAAYRLNAPENPYDPRYIPGDISFANVSDDLKLLAVGYFDGTVRVYNIESKEIVLETRAHGPSPSVVPGTFYRPTYITSIKFIKDSRDFFTAGNDGRLLFWKEGQNYSEIINYGSPINYFAISASNPPKLLVSPQKSLANVLDFGQMSMLNLNGINGIGLSATISSDGELNAIAYGTGYLSVFNKVGKKLNDYFLTEEIAAGNIAITSNNRYIYAAFGPTVQLIPLNIEDVYQGVCEKLRDIVLEYNNNTSNEICLD